MSVTVFYTSVSSSLKVKKDQEKIFNILDSNKIPFNRVDISQNSTDRDMMRKIAGNPTALPPQVCKGDKYCGDMAAFENAIEQENLHTFLKL